MNGLNLIKLLGNTHIIEFVYNSFNFVNVALLLYNNIFNEIGKKITRIIMVHIVLNYLYIFERLTFCLAHPSYLENARTSGNLSLSELIRSFRLK